jgi:hypothetical protein
MKNVIAPLVIAVLALGACREDRRFSNQEAASVANYIVIFCRNDTSGIDEPLGLAPDENGHIVPPGGGDGMLGYSHCHYKRVVG